MNLGRVAGGSGDVTFGAEWAYKPGTFESHCGEVYAGGTFLGLWRKASLQDVLIGGCWSPFPGHLAHQLSFSRLGREITHNIIK